MVADPHGNATEHGENAEEGRGDEGSPRARGERVDDVGHTDGKKQKSHELEIVSPGDERRAETEDTDNQRDHAEIPRGRNGRRDLMIERTKGLAARRRSEVLLLLDLLRLDPHAVGPILALVAEERVIGAILHLTERLVSRLGIETRFDKPVTLRRDVLRCLHHLPHVALVETLPVVAVADLVDHLPVLHEKQLVVAQLEMKKRPELVVHQGIQPRQLVQVPLGELGVIRVRRCRADRCFHRFHRGKASLSASGSSSLRTLAAAPLTGYSSWLAYG